MIGLLRKELRQLLPVAILVAATMSMNLVFTPFIERLDELSWTEAANGLEQGGGTAWAVLLLILALITSYSLFPREHDERTIEFIHALPVARWKPFAAKALAGLCIMVGGVVVGMSVDALLPILNHQTFSGQQFRMGTATKMTFLLAAYSAIVLCHGVLISFFRRFGLVLYGIVWWVIWTLEQGPRPSLRVNCMRILECEYFGTSLVIPWSLLGIHLLVAAAALVTGFLLWTFPPDGAVTWHSRLVTRLWGRLALVTGTMLIVLLVVSMAKRMVTDSPDTEQSAAFFRPFTTVRYHEPHYVFTYVANERTVAIPLIQGAEKVYELVREALGAASEPEIVVDLTAESTEHAGLAGWKTIRMTLHEDHDDEALLRVLAHETAHVFQQVESKRRIIDRENSTHFYDEGLAENLALRIMPDERTLQGYRLVAAAAWSRLEMKFEQMTDYETFRTLYDENLLYALGESWIDALRRVCGDEAPGNAVRALARDNYPANLGGSVLWQDTLQAIGCELESVNDAWRQGMNAIAGSSDAQLIPRLSGGVSGHDEESIILVAYLDRTIQDEDPIVMLRVRNAGDDPEINVQEYWGTVREGTDPLEAEFEVPSALLEGQRFDFQFGYLVVPGAPYYSERWRSTEVR